MGVFFFGWMKGTGEGETDQSVCPSIRKQTHTNLGLPFEILSGTHKMSGNLDLVSFLPENELKSAGNQRDMSGHWRRHTQKQFSDCA